MKSKYIIIIASMVVLIVIGMAAVSMQSGSNSNVAMNPSISDIHDINAQVFGNKNVTDGIPSYLTAESPTGVMPSSMLITVRSPGSSYFTLLINNSVVQNSLSVPLYHYHFNNITTQYYVSPTVNTTFIITVHSIYMNNTANSTRVFYYHANVKTPTQFITYMSSKVPVPPTSTISLSTAFLIFSPAAGVGVYVAYELAFFYAKSRRSHPNLADKVIGGMNDEE